MKVSMIVALACCLLVPMVGQAQEGSVSASTSDAASVAGEVQAKVLPRVAVETSMGKIVIELDTENAPISSENFLQYVKDGFYSGTVFHRVIAGFMIQGGGMTPDLKKKETREAIRNEADNGLRNVRGSIAMARTRNPHSATAQFYINLVDNAQLDHSNYSAQGGWGYTVFAKVVEGLDVVDAIAGVETTRQGQHANVPVEVVSITKASVVE